MLSGRQLSKSNLEVVGIVQGVEKILVERVDVCEAREAVKDGLDLLGKGLGGVLDFTDVEGYAMSISLLSSALNGGGQPLILEILNPARICVGKRRCVLLSTMSRNSCDVGTGAISFHVVFMVPVRSCENGCARR